MTRTILTTTALLAVSASLIAATHDYRVSAPRSCRVQGFWERIATIQGGKRTAVTGYREFKMLTRHNYVWLSAETRRDTLPLKTVSDTARYYGMQGGSGSYKVEGTKYIEHLTQFIDPKYENKDAVFSCRIDGNIWYHSFTTNQFGDTTAAGRDTTTEVWRRIE
jgi:hypothetical protein